jgi:hypothetical protein
MENFHGDENWKLYRLLEKTENGWKTLVVSQ